MLDINTSIKSVPRITPKYIRVLEKLGLFTVKDLLLYLPFRYDDFSKIVPLSKDFVGQAITTSGKIIKAKNNRLFRRKMTITEIIIEDENGEKLKAVWFNQPYILENFPVGSTARFSGKLGTAGKYFSMSNPAFEKSTRDATNTGCLVPIYSEASGITSKWIRWQIKTLLPLAKNMPDILPEEIRKKYNLSDIYTTLSQIHFPDNAEKLVRAQKRIAFQEMFLVQLKTLEIKKEFEEKNSNKIRFDEKLIKNFVSNLPFKLTNAQRKASFEILKDLERSHPMNRLLNGDVGSGKTIVAAISALQTISAGYQTAIMAPTEVLARQHFESFCEIFKNYDFNIALLTSSYKLVYQKNKNKLVRRDVLLEKIASGKINLVIGTHALIQKDVKFRNLALVIIDEQHRFGVNQRAMLQSETMHIDDGIKKSIPHLLTMTATPIPRTLAIAFFGSLDLSILDEMPKNRKPITTKIVTPSERNKIYEFIRSEIKKERQVFVILPLVEESLSESMLDVKAVKVEHERLSRKIFPEFKLGLLHGKLKAKEKEEVMENFKNKNFDILVSTSVVEVGIDIPNATVIVIENSERFGLTQLHQFRGRVGRGKEQSYCFLFTEKKPARLNIMEKTNDGFEISEHDLKLRGPGQFFGTIQSGLPDIAMEHLSNVKLIKFARAEAKDLLENDPELKGHPLLADALKKFSEKIHLE
ncbi:MAG: ATP-dependent DNA helicase [Candidatus Moranbacteria bacterium GW2011_GWF2_36_839]|nr:MAG: ATP-dependent DNA helicase [Candidatus Moranbacteria bacterium GW2011_GWF1_36_78]KKQ16395.1 MAG: ATP-dependent DNA helicase [Candidatus Moranbacteria bacterium GW2011_GWF2_36_839]HAT74344.1 DNA helicase RecG [Candidatus Moranbacteria bacterium]HBY11237.1 DNA helicase RecG [Candidatus Moranbacteria bacterium]